MMYPVVWAMMLSVACVLSGVVSFIVIGLWRELQLTVL